MIFFFLEILIVCNKGKSNFFYLTCGVNKLWKNGFLLDEVGMGVLSS